MMKITTLLLSLISIAQLHGQDYTSYNTLLKKYVSKDGVNYKKWAASTKDQQSLDQILKDWSKIKSSKLKKKDKAAFRINLYNASMVNVVLDNYPLSSVTKLGEPFSVFKKKVIQTPSGKISLDTLEKKKLLKDFPDARIHFAVNCASVSCPPLRHEAFTGEHLETQLEEQAKQFANSKHAVQIHGKTAKYSELFNWYAKDFKISHPATYINKYRTSKVSSSLKKDWIKYDWNLNSSN